MGDGTKGNPYTRADVIRLIEENGGKAEGLDLSHKMFEEGANLSGLDLEGIILTDAYFATHFEGNRLVGAKFDGANLSRSNLRNANLQYAQFKVFNGKPTLLGGADLRGAVLLNANFRGADLTVAQFGGTEKDVRGATLEDSDFRDTNLFLTNFKGCYFYKTKLQGAYIRGADIFDAHLEEANWGNYVVGDEKSGDFYSASHYYRRLKQWYTNAGMYDIAGKFFYREMEARRKAIKWWPNPMPKIRQTLYWLVNGYGEIPWRVFASAFAIILSLAIVYFAIGTLTPNGFLDCLYYSFVSFTAVGYGAWVRESAGWVKWLGVVETIVGVFLMALFLVTFTRKMTR